VAADVRVAEAADAVRGLAIVGYSREQPFEQPFEIRRLALAPRGVL
jgi:hypothetical protein